MIADHVVVCAKCHTGADDFGLLSGGGMKRSGNLTLRVTFYGVVLEHSDAQHSAKKLEAFPFHIAHTTTQFKLSAPDAKIFIIAAGANTVSLAERRTRRGPTLRLPGLPYAYTNNSWELDALVAAMVGRLAFEQILLISGIFDVELQP